MTVNTLTIELTCNGKTLKMGPGQDIDITAVSGLEASEVEISTSDNALVDGASVDGKKIKPRPIHIEASFRSSKAIDEQSGKSKQYPPLKIRQSEGIPEGVDHVISPQPFRLPLLFSSRLMR